MKGKIIIYSLSLALLFSCAGEHKIESVVATDREEFDAVPEMIVPVALEKPETVAYQVLAAKKIQELYDLKLLQEEYSEFASDIALQLKKLKEDALRIGTIAEKVQIKNVVTLIKQTTDSVQHLRVLFDVVSATGIKKDTLTAIVKRKRIQIDGQTSFETKLFFVKE